MRVLKTLHRVFITSESLAKNIIYYENLYQEDYFINFFYPELNLTLVQIGGILLISVDEDNWQLLHDLKKTTVTLIVNSIKDANNFFVGNEVTQILDEPKIVPTGWNMRIKSLDGTIAELVEHDQKKISAYRKPFKDLRFI